MGNKFKATEKLYQTNKSLKMSDLFLSWHQSVISAREKLNGAFGGGKKFCTSIAEVSNALMIYLFL